MKKIAVSLAALLLCGFALPVSQVAASQTPLVVSSSMVSLQLLTPQTTVILIENHAAPHWNLSVQEAWNAYDAGTLKIDEIIPEKQYRLSYDGGELIVLIENY